MPWKWLRKSRGRAELSCNSFCSETFLHVVISFEILQNVCWRHISRRQKAACTKVLCTICLVHEYRCGNLGNLNQHFPVSSKLRSIIDMPFLQQPSYHFFNMKKRTYSITDCHLPFRHRFKAVMVLSHVQLNFRSTWVCNKSMLRT